MNFWQTDRVRLRAIEPTDVEIFAHWNLDSDRARYLDFLWPPTSLASGKEWAEAQSKKKPEQDAYHWMIETLEGVPVGTISTHMCNQRDGTFSYGLDIAAEHRRKGYASAAIRLILRYYFEHLRYQKVTVNVHSDNLASLRLHESLGFQREGCLRRMCFQNGQYLDAIYFGMTVEEFQAAA
jgi:RimJ/RimL family protein N-acetyltransferase